MPRVMLSQSVSGTVDPTGKATLKLGPLSAREVWYPSNVHINVSTSVVESQAIVYAGESPTQGNFRDDSVSASSGDNTGACNADVLKTGQYIWAVWSGADVGAQATLTVTGLRDV